jgi:hypothetical protein
MKRRDPLGDVADQLDALAGVYHLHVPQVSALLRQVGTVPADGAGTNDRLRRLTNTQATLGLLLLDLSNAVTRATDAAAVLRDLTADTPPAAVAKSVT